MEPKRIARDLDCFRDYLRLLAQGQLGRDLRGRVDPSDVVQQALIEAHDARERFDGNEDGRAAWLRRILANNIANAARDHRRAKRDVRLERSIEQSLDHSSARLVACLAADASSPSERVSRDEEILRLVDALEGLPELEREVVLRRHWHEETLAQIAAAVGSSEYLVAQNLRRGLSALRRLLQARSGPGQGD